MLKKMMITLLIGASTLLTASKSYCLNQDVLFQRVTDDANRLKVPGWDVLACTDSNGRLILGGMQAWNRPLQVIWYGYGDNQASQAGVAVKMILQDSNAQEFSFTIPGGMQMSYSGPKQWTRQSIGQAIVQGAGTIVNINGESSGLVCIFRSSGLE